MDDDLPGYFDEPDPEPEPRAGVAVLVPPRPRVRPWATEELVPLGAATQPATPSAVVVQVVPIRPDDAARRLAAWATSTATRRRPWFAGRDRLVVRPGRTYAPAAGRTCCAWHVRVDVRSPARPAMTIEVGCAPWSTTRAELHVVPVRTVRDRRRYYRAAHAVLDRLVRELR